jgi:hypothetical protein
VASRFKGQELFREKKRGKEGEQQGTAFNAEPSGQKEWMEFRKRRGEMKGERKRNQMDPTQTNLMGRI